MNQEEDYVSTGEPFFMHVWKARDITSTKIFCDLFNKLPMTSIGLLTRLSLMSSLLPRGTQPLDPTEFLVVSADVPVALDLSSSFTPLKPSWREGTFLLVLLKVGQS